MCKGKEGAGTTGKVWQGPKVQVGRTRAGRQADPGKGKVCANCVCRQAETNQNPKRKKKAGSSVVAEEGKVFLQGLQAGEGGKARQGQRQGRQGRQGKGKTCRSRSRKQQPVRVCEHANQAARHGKRAGTKCVSAQAGESGIERKAKQNAKRERCVQGVV